MVLILDNDLKPLYFTLAIISASFLVKRAYQSTNIYDFFNIKKKCNPFPQSQSELVDLLHYQKRMVLNKTIVETLKFVDRKLFLENENVENPYYDEPKPIGYNATISAPHMHALMLDLLADRIPMSNGVALDIGSGSGYVTACLGHLMGCTGRVIGVEHIPELIERSTESIKRLDSTLLDRIQFLVGDGIKGWKQLKYDIIYLGAAIESLQVARELIDQLKNGGRIVMPVGKSNDFHELMVVDKNEDGIVSIKSLGVVRFVPLTSKENQLNPRNKPNATKVTNINGEKTLIRCEIIPAPDSNSINNIKEFENLINKK
ncbi:hypothetical protein ACTFIR_000267 [Dictyostelium discoideum]